MKDATKNSIESTKRTLQYIDEIRDLIKQIKVDLQQKDVYISTRNGNQTHNIEPLHTSVI